MSKAKKTIVNKLLSIIRQAERNGITRYRIAKESGVDAAQLYRIVHHGAIPGLDKAARIAEALGYDLIFQSKEKSN